MTTPSIAQLQNGPPSIDLLTAAAVLRIGRTKAYELARRGEFPVKVIRIGGSWARPRRRAARTTRHQPGPASRR